MASYQQYICIASKHDYFVQASEKGRGNHTENFDDKKKKRVAAISY